VIAILIYNLPFSKRSRLGDHHLRRFIVRRRAVMATWLSGVFFTE
jgi:hypothetical protein